MKQQITKEQWNELTQKQKEKIVEFFWNGLRMDFTNKDINKREIEPKNLSPINIGKMIEFSGQRIKDGKMVHEEESMIFIQEWRHKLCDLLWEKTKELLKLCQ